MRILLIDPPMQKFMGFRKYHLPLGLLCLAAIEKDRHEVAVYDADYNPDGKAMGFVEKHQHYRDYLSGLKDGTAVWAEIESVLNTFRPNLVGITIISPKLPSALRIAEMARKKGAFVLAGGPHVSVCPEQLRETGKFDALMHRPLNELPAPARECLLNLKDYRTSDLGTVMTAYGCPFDCSFCCSRALWGREVVYRSVADVVQEMADVEVQFGTTEFYIVDDTFSCRRGRVLAFCDQARQHSWSWSCLTRADSIDAEMIRAMRTAGCAQVKIGLESASERILALMNKRQTPEDIRQAARILRAEGMPWTAYGMFGLPSETEAEIQQTLDFVEETQPRFFSPSLFTPYPGTKLYEQMDLSSLDYEQYSQHGTISATGLSAQIIDRVFQFADEYNTCQSES